MITKLSQLEQDQMCLLCIHIEYVLVHDSIRWDLMWPQSISPTNQCCATCKGASSCAGAARAALAAPRTRGARPCRALGKNRSGRPRLGRARAPQAATSLRVGAARALGGADRHRGSHPHSAVPGPCQSTAPACREGCRAAGMEAGAAGWAAPPRQAAESGWGGSPGRAATPVPRRAAESGPRVRARRLLLRRQ
jgi:hypothetical protein